MYSWYCIRRIWGLWTSKSLEEESPEPASFLKYFRPKASISSTTLPSTIFWGIMVSSTKAFAFPASRSHEASFHVLSISSRTSSAEA